MTDPIGVNLLPASNEWVYDTLPHRAQRATESSPTVQNVNLVSGGTKTDYSYAIDQLQATYPGCRTVSLVCAWFGNATDVTRCAIYPSTTFINGTAAVLSGGSWSAEPWRCCGLTQASPGLIPISQSEAGRFVYGGTPSDASVVRCIRDLKARGFRVTFYPFILMDCTGYAAAKLAEVVTNTRTSIADTNYTASASDRTIAMTALSAARTVTLPAAAAYPTGTQLLVVDESGGASATNAITLMRAGSDLVNGATSAVIATAYGYVALESNGVSRWTIIDQIPYSTLTTVAQSANGATMQFGIVEQLVTLSGAAVTTTLLIPARAIVFCVSSRTVTAVTGAPSYGVGVSGNTTQFGGSLGASIGSSNAGVIGPTAFYAATPIVVTATSGSFTAGQVRLAIQCLLCGVPTA